jgi:hypothetical protein
MYQDKALLVSDGQTITSTGASTDYIDLGAARDISRGEPLWLIAVITATSGISPTINMALQTDDNTSFSSALTVATTGTLTSPAAGTTLILAVALQSAQAAERYLRAYFTLGGTSPSFTLDCWITNQAPQQWAATADAI